uniref:Uncharacterized protein n=1 Tax=Pseudo-nitzschia australis TaxID=44445 RepID=A0A7S4AST2_9STRA
MDSAFSYLQSLVDAFEDVGGKGGNERKHERRTKRNGDHRSVCDQAGGALPTCSIDIETMAGVLADDPKQRGNSSIGRSMVFCDDDDIDIEHQGSSNRRGNKSGSTETRKKSLSPKSSSRGRENTNNSKNALSSISTSTLSTAMTSPSSSLSLLSSSNNTTNTSPSSPSMSVLLKSKSLEIASKISLFQSFSNTDSTSPYEVKKSGSSLSKTTAGSNSSSEEETGNDFPWARSLSSNSNNSRFVDEHHDRKHKERNHFFSDDDTEDDALFGSKKNGTDGSKNYQQNRQQHIKWWSHGFVWTCIAISFGWCGVGLSFCSRQSTDFVALNMPMYLDPRYQEIPSVGMIQLELCLNTTYTEIRDQLDDDYNYEPKQQRNYELLSYEQNNVIDLHANEDSGTSSTDSTTACLVHRLTSDDTHDDTMYTVSQSVAFLGLVFGIFVTTCLTCSVAWKSINLRPIGFGYLVAYFLQSFTFLVFDSNICTDQGGCTMGRGGNLSAVASVCWIVSCAATSRMDKRKHKNEQQQQHDAAGDGNNFDDDDESATGEDFEQMCQQQTLIMKEIERNNAKAAAAATTSSPRSNKEKRQTKRKEGQSSTSPSSSSRSPKSVGSSSLEKPKALESRDRSITAETAPYASDDDDESSLTTPHEHQDSGVVSVGADQWNGTSTSTTPTSSITASKIDPTTIPTTTGSLSLSPPPPPPGIPRRSSRKSKKNRPTTKRIASSRNNANSQSNVDVAEHEQQQQQQRVTGIRDNDDGNAYSSIQPTTRTKKEDASGKLRTSLRIHRRRAEESSQQQPSQKQRQRSPKKGRRMDLTVDIADANRSSTRNSAADDEFLPSPSTKKQLSPTAIENSHRIIKPMENHPPSYIATTPPASRNNNNNRSRNSVGDESESPIKKQQKAPTASSVIEKSPRTIKPIKTPSSYIATPPSHNSKGENECNDQGQREQQRVFDFPSPDATTSKKERQEVVKSKKRSSSRPRTRKSTAASDNEGNTSYRGSSRQAFEESTRDFEL